MEGLCRWVGRGEVVGGLWLLWSAEVGVILDFVGITNDEEQLEVVGCPLFRSLLRGRDGLAQSRYRR